MLVADTRGEELLVFGADPLILRQRYPVRGAPYGLAGSDRLAWVSQTATNSVVGYDLATGIPVEKVRYPTVRQPNSLSFDDDDQHPVRGVGLGGGVQVIAERVPRDGASSAAGCPRGGKPTSPTTTSGFRCGFRPT